MKRASVMAIALVLLIAVVAYSGCGTNKTAGTGFYKPSANMPEISSPPIPQLTSPQAQPSSPEEYEPPPQEPVSPPEPSAPVPSEPAPAPQPEPPPPHAPHDISRSGPVGPWRDLRMPGQNRLAGLEYGVSAGCDWWAATCRSKVDVSAALREA